MVRGANDDVWVYDIPRQTLTRLTSQSRSMSPIWTSDGKRIIYRSVRAGALNLFAKAADGSGEEERLTEGRFNQLASSTSPDGQAMVFLENTDLWILPLTGEGRSPRPFVKSPFDEGPVSAFSPDGRWLAYSSNESGRREIYVQPFPAGGRKVQISRDGGAEPRWVRSGELFYRNGDKVMALALPTQPTLSVRQSRMLFERPQYANDGASSFDVSPDGQRLLMIKEDEHAASATQIDVVLNWFDELKRLVPTK